MQTAAQIWADEEFGGAKLGDARRTARLIKVGAAVAACPGGRVTSAIRNSAEREAAYRFVESAEVSAPEIGASIFRACALRCASYRRVPVGVDQSTVSITDRAGTKGLGRTGGSFAIGGRRGYEVMSAVAVGSDGTTVGLLAQAWHLRSDAPSPPACHDTRSVDERESGLWLRCMRAAANTLAEKAPQTRAWFQLDRGADMNHVLLDAMTLNADFTVRARYDRHLDGGGRLQSSLRNSRALGTIETTIVDSHALAGTERARRTTLTLRARQVTLSIRDRHGRGRGALSIHACACTRDAPRPTRAHRVVPADQREGRVVAGGVAGRECVPSTLARRGFSSRMEDRRLRRRGVPAQVRRRVSPVGYHPRCRGLTSRTPQDHGPR